jgi:hypothetical protein
VTTRLHAQWRIQGPQTSTQGLQQSQVDQCLYFLPGKLWVTFWVDDFLVMGSDRATTDKFKASISAHFRMRDLGLLEILGNFNIHNCGSTFG